MYLNIANSNLNIFFIFYSHLSGHSESKATLEPLKKILTHKEKKKLQCA